jgi:hypothetical protein
VQAAHTSIRSASSRIAAVMVKGLEACDATNCSISRTVGSPGGNAAAVATHNGLPSTKEAQ